MDKPTVQVAVSDDFARLMRAVHGEAAEPWLRELPALIADIAARWRLAMEPPFEPLTFNYVAPAVAADGTRVVLKIGFPDKEYLAGLEALRLFDGRGIARLLAVDRQRNAMLLERLTPGRQLSTLADDAAATSIAADVMRQLWRPAPEGYPFPAVGDWAAGLGRLRDAYNGETGPLPARLVEQAETLFADLLASQGLPMLLHGDLHHFNILSAERAPWLAIDPKGLIGEPEYETSALLRNPFPGLFDRPDAAKQLTRRVDQLAEELAFDRGRVRGWGIAQAVLSAWWSLEDNVAGWEHDIAVAELLAATPE